MNFFVSLINRYRFQVKFERNSKIKCGKSPKFGRNTYLTARGGEIVIGDFFHCNQDVILNADVGGKLTIGNHCLFGPRVMIRTSNHAYLDPQKLISSQGHISSNIHIGNDVWLGSAVIVLPGVTIGEGSVVGAGSIVTKNIEPYSVVAGNPARLIRRRTKNFN